MKHVDPAALTSPQPAAKALRAATLVIYGTLILLALTVPQSLTNWLREMNENPLEVLALRGAEAWQSAAERSGLPAVYRRARDLFIAVSGVEPD
jgi:hypothetical protein